MDMNAMGCKKRGGCYEYQELPWSEQVPRWHHMHSDDDFYIMFVTEIYYHKKNNVIVLKRF